MVAKKRVELEQRRERLTLAASAMASIQVYTAPVVAPAPAPAAVAPEPTPSKAAGTRLYLAINNGPTGIGIVVQLDDEQHLMIGGFRTMPDGSASPGVKGGLKVGDVIEEIQGEAVSTIDQVKRILMANKGSVTFTVLRKT